jgi:hypothetical protein
MRHFCEDFIERNCAIVSELCDLALSIWRKNRFCCDILIGDQSNSITKVFAVNGIPGGCHSITSGRSEQSLSKIDIRLVWNSRIYL